MILHQSSSFWGKYLLYVIIVYNYHHYTKYFMNKNIAPKRTVDLFVRSSFCVVIKTLRLIKSLHKVIAFPKSNSFVIIIFSLNLKYLLMKTCYLLFVRESFTLSNLFNSFRLRKWTWKILKSIPSIT